MTLVIDASMVAAALVDSGPDGSWADQLMTTDHVAAPHLMPVEVANILHRAARSGDISADSAALAHQDLLDLRVELFPYEPFAQRVWQLRHNITAYDAWYVALAETRIARHIGPSPCDGFGSPLPIRDPIAAAPSTHRAVGGIRGPAGGNTTTRRARVSDPSPPAPLFCPSCPGSSGAARAGTLLAAAPTGRMGLVEITRLHHVAFAHGEGERPFDAFASLLGLGVTHVEDGDGFIERMTPVGDCYLQTLEATGKGVVERFVGRRGAALHHIALGVTDLEDALTELRAAGARLVDEQPRRGGMGTRIAFIHPESFGGLLVELVEEPGPEGRHG